MIKDIINKNENKQYNSDAIEHLKKYFPNCFNKANQFDLDKFKDIIGQNNIDTINEGYNLNFLGKNYARLIASTDTTTIIKPDIVHNLNDENKNSENIYISGDNIDSLKHLLKSYSNKIKCIYIDPPYNTGTDNFVYNDKFNFTVDDLQTKLSIGYEQAKKIIDFTKKGSSSHSAWLMFMAPRLQLARDLLTDNGVIFISIDDNEQANLKLLCDEIFGEENFVANMIRQEKAGSGHDSKGLAIEYDYIICYSKNNFETTINKELVNVKDDDKYKLVDEFLSERGKFYLRDLDYKGSYSKSMDYPILLPNGKEIWAGGKQGEPNTWRWSKEKFEWGLKNNFIVFKDEKVYIKQYQFVDNKGKNRIRMLPFRALIKFLNSEGTRDLTELKLNSVFSFPKSVNMIKYLLKISTNTNSLVLDFFSGSGTTAHAVMQLNAEDGGNRKFILCQIEEPIPKDKPAYKSGYKTVDEIGIERIKRAAKKIKESNPLFNGDLGFKHYSLVELPENTINKLYEFNSNTILLDSTAIINDLGKDSILETWLVRDGYGFGAEISKIELNNYTAYYCNKHIYLIDTDFNEDSMCALIKKIGDEKDFNPETIVLFGYNFTFTQLEMIEKNIITLQNNDKNLNVNIDIRH